VLEQELRAVTGEREADRTLHTYETLARWTLTPP
jgi:hypothetical protein